MKFVHPIIQRYDSLIRDKEAADICQCISAVTITTMLGSLADVIDSASMRHFAEVSAIGVAHYALEIYDSRVRLSELRSVSPVRLFGDAMKYLDKYEALYSMNGPDNHR